MINARGVVAVLALAMLHAPASGHGGCYSHNYPGEVPPDSREPPDPPPPPVIGCGGPTRRHQSPGADDWTRWWSAAGATLGPRRGASAVAPPAVTPGARRFGRAGDGLVPATRAAVHERVVPALRRLLEDSTVNGDIRAAAAIALAKIGDESIVPALRALAIGGPDGDRLTQETAALSLGILQVRTDEVLDTLLELVADTSRKSSFVRPYAAISLGLLAGDPPAPRVSEALLAVLGGDEAGPDVKPACFLALGLSGDPSVVTDLATAVETGDLWRTRGAAFTDVERAHAAMALGRSQDPRAAGALIRVVELSRRHPAVVRRAAISALGFLRGTLDESTRWRVSGLLRRVASNDRRLGNATSLRNAALLACGRLAAAPDADDELRGGAAAFLRDRLDGAPAAEQPFAGIALGMLGGGGGRREPAFVETEVWKPLRRRFADTADRRARGAFALASGLASDRLSAPALLETLLDRGDGYELRGHCALALGLLGDRSAAAPLVDVLLTEGDRALRLDSARAAAVVCNGEGVAALVALLRSPDASQYELGSIVLALGHIGDERAVDPLLEVAEDDQRWPDLTRALAVVALGLLGDTAERPVLAQIAEMVDGPATTPAMADLLTIL